MTLNLTLTIFTSLLTVKINHLKINICDLKQILKIRLIKGNLSEDPRWIRLVGGEHKIESSSNVGTGGVYVLDRPWVRMLETQDLNLANAK